MIKTVKKSLIIFHIQHHFISQMYFQTMTDRPLNMFLIHCMPLRQEMTLWTITGAFQAKDISHKLCVYGLAAKHDQ